MLRQTFGDLVLSTDYVVTDCHNIRHGTINLESERTVLDFTRNQRSIIKQLDGKIDSQLEFQYEELGNGNIQITGIKYYLHPTELNNELVIPNRINNFNVIKIADNAFWNLKFIFADSDLPVIITIQNGIREIGNKAFSHNHTIEHVNIPNSVSSIGKYAFHKCTSLSSINLNKVTYIGIGAFSGCQNLYDVKITNSVSAIDDYAFENCSSLSSINLNNVEEIGDYIFSRCSNLTSISIGNKFKKFSNKSFKNLNTVYDVDIKLDSVSFVNLPNFPGYLSGNVQCTDISGKVELKLLYQTYWLYTFLNYATFYGLNDSLYTFELSNKIDKYNIIGITYLSNSISTIQNFKIDDTIKNVNDSAFSNCSNLYSIHLPKSLNYLGKKVFNNCNNLSVSFSDILHVNEDIINVLSYDLQEVQFITENTDNPDLVLTATTYVANINGITGDYNYNKILVLPQYIVSNIKYPNNTELTQIEDSETDVEFSYTYPISCINENAFTNIPSNIDIYIPSQIKREDIHVNAFNKNAKLHYYDSLLLYQNELSIPNGITDINYKTFYNCKSIKKINLKPITFIDDYAFTNCEKLYDVGHSIDITYIGEHAFENCYDLEFIPNLESLSCIKRSSFRNCKSITDLYIHTNVNFIEEQAFDNCTNLTSLVFDENSSLSTIESKAFNYCQNLEELLLPNNVLSIKSQAFSGCKSLLNLNLNDKLQYIDEYAFDYCMSLQYLNLPESIKYIGKYAFYNCTNLEHLDIHSTISAIEKYTFGDCFNLGSINFYSNTIQKIDDYSFYNCPDLSSLDFSTQTITSIGEYAFWNCKSLIDLRFSDNLEVINKYAFYNCLNSQFTYLEFNSKIVEIKENAFENCHSLSTINFNNCSCLSIIDNFAFNNCYNLKNIQLDYCTKLKIINKESFANCHQLELLNVMPATNLKNINERAFANCYNLKNILLNLNIEYIGIMSFINCNSIQNITLTKNLSLIDNYAFYNSNNCCPNLLDYGSFKNLSLTHPYFGLNHWGLDAFIYVDNTYTVFTLLSTDNYFSITGLNPETSANIKNDTTLTIYSAYNGCIIKNILPNALNNKLNDTSISNIVIDNLIEEVGASSFANNKKIQRLVLPTDLSVVPDNCFLNCSSLSDISLPTNILSINDFAFSNNNITSITIPKKLRYLSLNCFNNKNLEIIIFKGNIPRNLRNITTDSNIYDMFKFATNLSIFYPKNNTTWINTFENLSNSIISSKYIIDIDAKIYKWGNAIVNPI